MITEIITAITTRKRVAITYMKQRVKKVYKKLEIYCYGINESNGKQYIRIYDVTDKKWKLFLLENIIDISLIENDNIRVLNSDYNHYSDAVITKIIAKI